MKSHCKPMELFNGDIHILDGATGTQLITAGMPRHYCQEKWILDNPHTILDLQRRYAAAGSEVIYAPTFQANSLALARHDLKSEHDDINTRLVTLSRSAAPDCLIAGNLTTLRGCIDTSDESKFTLMTSVYKKQIHALVRGGVDMIAAETLLHPLEAKSVLLAAKEEGILYTIISFALKPDGTLRSGHAAESVFHDIEQAGAAAVGMNCITADNKLPHLVNKLKQSVSIPLICKPNTGRSINGVPPVDIDMFTDIMSRCAENGASLIGGCCGTTPAHIAALKSLIIRSGNNIE